MACDCISSNRPDLGGSVPEKILHPGVYFDHIPMEETVSVDACIVHEVVALWKSGIDTVGSCCGHNGRVGFRSIVLATATQREQAREILDRMSAQDTKVGAWELVWS